ncbi:MAG: phosphatidate cytidylyltransferase [Burkholderiales bacterium]
MLRQRLLTIALILPIFLGGIGLLPNAVWALLILLPLGIAAMEWSALGGYRGGRWSFAAVVVASGLTLYAWVYFRAQTAQPSGLHVLFQISMLFWVVVAPLWLRYRWSARPLLLHAATGWIVLVPTWLALVMLQQVPSVLIILLGVAWVADTAAYFCGRQFGRRKLAPHISPGKTWEGVLGAYLAVGAYGLVVSWVPQYFAQSIHLFELLVLFFSLATLSIVGDLFESWIKRQAGAKDSGSLMPGHGGVLDRIDSLTAVLPIAALYYFMRIAQP